MLRIRIGKFSLTLAFRRRQLMALLFLAGAALFAAAITKPHTFSDGDTLSAAKLNENFDALHTKVNELDAWKTAEEAKGKSWRLIYETDVASATTSINVTGLNGDVDVEYKIIAKIVGNFAGLANYFVRLNGDTNTANYWSQYGGSTSGAPVGIFNATNVGLSLGFTNATNNLTFTEGILLAKTGTKRPFLCIVNGDVSTQIAASHAKSEVWANSATNITTMEFMSNQTNGIGAGSHIEIWARR